MLKIDAKARKVSIPRGFSNLELSPENESLQKALSPLLGKDDLRPVFMGIYFSADKNEIVATDAHKLIRLSYDGDVNKIVRTKKAVEKEWKRFNKGLSRENMLSFPQFISKYPRYKYIDGNYPVVDSVIPQPNNLRQPVDVQKLYWFSQSLIKAKSKNESILGDRDSAFVRVTDSFGEKVLVKLNVKYLSVISKSLLQLSSLWDGKTILPYQYVKKSIQIFPKGHGLDTALLMPLLLEDDDTIDTPINKHQPDNLINVVYDLDENKIYSNGKLYDINESLGFVPLGKKVSTTKKTVKKAVEVPVTREIIEEQIEALKLALNYY
jgi:hypothetical protein